MFSLALLLASTRHGCHGQGSFRGYRLFLCLRAPSCSLSAVVRSAATVLARRRRRASRPVAPAASCSGRPLARPRSATDQRGLGEASRFTHAIGVASAGLNRHRSASSCGRWCRGRSHHPATARASPRIAPRCSTSTAAPRNATAVATPPSPSGCPRACVARVPRAAPGHAADAREHGRVCCCFCAARQPPLRWESAGAGCPLLLCVRAEEERR